MYLHGFASSSGSAKGQFFRERFKGLGVDLILPDLDEGDFETLTISSQLQLVSKLCKDTGPRLLMGSSLGGYLAALHAARPDTDPVPLVLLAPAFDFVRRWNIRLGKGMERWKQNGSVELYHYGLKAPANLGYWFYQDALQYEPFPEVTTAVKILHGLKDEVVDPELSKTYANRQPNVAVEWFDSDHQLLNVTAGLWKSVKKFYHQQ